jgi:hypothetical protein
MTRVNAGVDPALLHPKQLLAEHYEMVRIPNSIRKGRAKIDDKLPKAFTLGKGHVRFFYDKLDYLRARYFEVRSECVKRGFNVQDFSSAFDGIPEKLFQSGWCPSAADRSLVVERIQQRGFSLRLQQEP